MEDKSPIKPLDSPKPAKRVIRLEDLDGDEEITGGAGGKLFFGEQPEIESPFAGLFGGPGKK